MARVFRIPFSTNVERVSLALAHKSIPVEWVDVDPADRSAVVELSGQDLVPVLQADHGEIVVDSMRIVAWLEKRRPDPPLWPAHAGRRAEVDIFIEWFDKVWKVPPNAMVDETDEERLHDLSAEMRGWLHLFEELLDGRDWLLTESFGAADLCAFPFLKYGVLSAPDDDDRFHHILAEHLPIEGAFPAIEAWVHRVDALPRA